jgi:hypothetical protein
MVLFASGIGLTIISFLFIFPYLGLYAIEQFENITITPMELTGLENPLNLFVFAVLFIGGLGLLVKGFS